MFGTKVIEKVRTHFLCSAKHSEKRNVYEITWKNVVQPNRLQKTIWRREYASYRNTSMIFNTYFSPPPTITTVMRTRLFCLMLRVLYNYNMNGSDLIVSLRQDFPTSHFPLTEAFVSHLVTNSLSIPVRVLYLSATVSQPFPPQNNL